MLALAERAFSPARIPSRSCTWTPGATSPRSWTSGTAGSKQTGVRLVVASVQESIDAGRVAEETGRWASRNRLQTVTLLDAISDHRFDAVFGGARRDEEKARAKERVFSFRDEFGQWDPRTSGPSVEHLQHQDQDGRAHTGVPAVQLDRVDVWQYIARENLEIPSIYFAHPVAFSSGTGCCWPTTSTSPRRRRGGVREATVRYRTVGDMTCTGAVESAAATIEEVITEIAATRITERGQTRADDRTSEAAMEDRKKEGYF